VPLAVLPLNGPLNATATFDAFVNDTSLLLLTVQWPADAPRYEPLALTQSRGPRVANATVSFLASSNAIAIHSRGGFAGFVSPYAGALVGLTLTVRAPCGDNATFAFPITVTPQPFAVPLIAIAATTTAATSVAAVSGSPATAATAARVASLQKLLVCAASFTEEVDGSLTGLAVGPAHGAYLRGAMVGNALVVVGGFCALVVLAACVVAALGRKHSLGDALLALHWPSCAYPVAMAVLQPTASAAVTLLFAPLGGGDVALSVAALLLGCALVAAVARLLLGPAFPGSLAEREAAKPEDVGAAGVLRRALRSRFLVSSQHWVYADGRPSAFKRRYMLLLEGVGRAWFPVLDVSLALASGVVLGVPPSAGPGTAVCVWQAAVMAAVFAALLVCGAVLRAVLSPFGTACCVLTNALGVVASLSLVVALSSPAQSARATDAAAACALMMSVVSGAKSLVDIATLLSAVALPKLSAASVDDESVASVPAAVPVPLVCVTDDAAADIAPAELVSLNPP
ncbi:MAG: hypothetical protein Q8R13_01640, partial [bacterium]|nr:hypothetical protein [bacterium]